MNMIRWVLNNWTTIALVTGVLGIGFEVAPQKIKPISWVIKWMGARMYEPVNKQIEDMKTELKSFRKEYDDGKIDSIRRDIIQFSLSLQRHEKHTRQDYQRIFEQIDKYHDLLDKYGRENGVIDIEQKYIQGIYLECLESDKFFQG